MLPQLAAHPKPISISEWAYSGGRYPTYPAFAMVFHEMFRHSGLFRMATYTFATSLLARDGTNVSLNANGLAFKIYRDHFGSIPVEVSGNSPQPKPTDPPGGEQPAVNAGGDTFPLDVAAAWTDDHRTLTVAVINPTGVEQPLKLRSPALGCPRKARCGDSRPLKAAAKIRASAVRRWIPSPTCSPFRASA